MVAVMHPGTVVRPMSQGDLVTVTGVEQACYDYPWSRRIFEDCLEVGYCCLVVEDRGQVVGHGIMLVSAGEAHILNLCIMPEHRERGLARLLLHELLDLAERTRAELVLLEVRPSNRAAIHLYESDGFRRIGHRPEYYPAPFGREDAVVMSRRLESAD